VILAYLHACVCVLERDCVRVFVPVRMSEFDHIQCTCMHISVSYELIKASSIKYIHVCRTPWSSWRRGR